MATRSRPAQAASPLLAERYGQPGRWSRPLGVGLVALLGAAGLAWVLWAGLAQSSRAVSAQVVSFDVLSEHRVVVTLTVQRREGDMVLCEVYAQAADYVVVGERALRIPPGAARVTVEDQITTERAATTVVLRACEAAPSRAERPTPPGGT